MDRSDRVLIFLGNAHTRVGHLHQKILGVGPHGRDADPPSLRRELDRVGQQVVENLLHFGLILAQRRQLRRRLRDGTYEDVDNHPALDLIDYDLLEAVTSWLEITGNAYIATNKS